MKEIKSLKIASFLAGAILLGTSSNLPVRAADYPTLIEAQSPLDYWRLNETTPSPAVQTIANWGSAGARAAGIVVNAQTGQPGIVGNSLLLINTGQGVGNCSSRVDIPNLPVLNTEPPFTIEFWAKPNAPYAPSDATGLCVLSSISPFPGDGSRSGYLFYATPTAWTLRIGGEDSYAVTATANVTVSTASFTHVVGEFDGTTATIYINGVLEGSSSPVAPFHPNIWVPTRIGGTDLPGSEYEDANGNGDYGEGNRGFDGWVDEFAVYNTLLSSNTIMAHYTTATSNPSGYDALILASSPVGYWNMDEPAYTAPDPSTYTFAADLGSLGDNGTNTLGTLADQPGVPGLSADDHSVYFNGAAGSLVLDTNVTAPDISGQPITLAAWIKPNSFGYVSDIIAQGYDEKTYAENFLRVGDAFDWECFSPNNSGGNVNPLINPYTGAGADVVFYEVGAYDGGGAYASALFPANPGDIGNWVFLVGTYDGANWNLYRNAVLVAQGTGNFGDGTSGPAPVNAPWAVGSRSNPSPYFGFFFDGSISEAAIFTSALDASTILALYNSVALPPVITEAPVAPSPAYLGSAAAFSVLADGPGTLTYQWAFDGAAQTGQTATTYSLTGLTAADDGTYSVIVSNQYGAATSSVVLVVTPSLPPANLTPASETRWIGSPLSFAPVSLPNQQLSFQWDLNGNAISGATQSSYTATTASGSAGSYTLVLSNSFGSATSSVATLLVLTPPSVFPLGYPSAVLADHPVAYYRLDETNGTTAYDYAGGNDGTYTGSYELGQPGYSYLDPDTAVTFSGRPDSYAGGIDGTTINFPGTNAEFSIEAWANGGVQQIANAAVVAKGTLNNGGNYTAQFAIIDSGGDYAFVVTDPKSTLTSATASVGPDGAWHHLVGVFDGIGGSLSLYIDGALAASAAAPGDGLINSSDTVAIGAMRSGPVPTYDLDYTGTIDEVAIYHTALSAAQVLAHFTVVYGPSTSPILTVVPVSLTNYLNLPATLTSYAVGTVPLTYQWNKAGSGPISGATANAFTIPNLAYTDAGTYTVGITNAVSGIITVPVTITVLAPPTNPPAIAGLVLHLPFDGNLIDATGRGNNATNQASGGAPLLTTDYVPGQIGQAFTYQTTTSPTTNANYATLGVRPDLQFGSGTSFTVSCWIQEPGNYTGNDLPFLCDVVGSTFGHPGYCFCPSFGGATANWPGGWAYSVYDTTDAGIGVYGDVGTINDGNFHNLVYVIDRTAGASVYVDGALAHQNVQEGTTVANIGDIDTTNAAIIGQDPTGLYPQPSLGNFAIDDLGIWNRALTPLEAASIYAAGALATTPMSFTGGAAPPTLTLQVIAGPQLRLTWTAGTLQSATSLNGPWTAVAGAASPYVASPTGASMFFRLKL